MSFISKTDVKRIAKIASQLYEAQDRLREMLERYQEKLEAKSERWQESDAGQQAQDFLSNLEQATDDAEALANALDDLTSTEED